MRSSWRAAWFGVLLSGCASGDGDAGGECGGGCPRGLECRSDRCVQPERDAAPAADVLPAADAARDGALPDGAMPDGTAPDGGTPDGASADMAVPTDAAVADMARPDAAMACEVGAIDDCGSNMGRCRRGRRVCGEDGAWGPCEGEIGPLAEVCNGADDDCNGTVDDGFGVDAPCDGVGACGEGRVECRDDFQTRCSTDPGGSRTEVHAERCDGADDDCDGRVDEDFRLGRDCVGRCGPGTVECSEGGEGAICSTDDGGSESTVREETCNRRDDDCDGTVDEGFRLGEACDGQGACGAGVFECGDGGQARCSTEPGGAADQAVPEACNARDDDCDGTVDEGQGVGDPCDGVGGCGRGVTECAPDGTRRCSTDPGGTQSEEGVEVCNAADDDCDGRADEGLGLGDACGAIGVCPAGQQECGPGDAVVCSTRAGGSADVSRAEACNMLDDDCDGRADEDFALGQPCVGRGICGAGVVECDDDGAAHCSTEPGGSRDASGAEGCNGRDDDCDGLTDEGGACSGDDCREAPLLALGDTVSGNTAMLASDYARSTCFANSPGNDQVFRVVIPAAGNYVVGVAPLAGDFDPMFFVGTACTEENVANCVLPTAGRDTNAAGRPEARSIAFPRGDTFWLIVDARVVGRGGPFAVSARPTADGEACENPIALALPARFVGTTEAVGGRRNDVAGTRCPADRITTGPDQVFSVQVPRAGRLRVRVTPDAGAVNPILQLVRDCAAIDDSCVAGVDANAGGGTEVLEAAVEPGAYFIVVDHIGNPGGAFFLEAEML